MGTGERRSSAAGGAVGRGRASHGIVLELGRGAFTSWERVLHWSIAAGALSLLLLVATAMLGRDADSTSPLLVPGLLALTGSALGVFVALRSARLVRVHPAGGLSVVRLLLPARQYDEVTAIVIDEESWRLYEGSDDGDIPLPTTTDRAGGGLASLTAVCRDGQEVPLAEVDWTDRQAFADRIAAMVGATIVTRTSTRTASCG